MANPATRDARLLVLVSLAGGPKHGHAMLRDIASFAGVRLGPGSLYGAISGLETDGLIEPMAADDRRRPYRLTRTGRRHLADRLDAMRTTLRIGLQRVAT